MSYLGKTQFKSSDIQRFDVTSSTSATHVLSWTAANEQSLIVTINGVKQQDDAYSISGSPTTVTLTSALVATDKLEIVGIVDVGTMNVPGVGSVQTELLADDAVTAAKMADDAVGVAVLSATGTASSSTFLRGDNSWASAGLSGWSENGVNNDLLPASTSAGIYLGVNSATASNLLDDYEEGSWSPVPKAGGTDINMGSASTGAYYKVGKIIYLRAQLRMNRGTNTGAFTFTGLPFAPNDSAYAAGANCHLSFKPNDYVRAHAVTGSGDPYVWSIDNSSVVYAFSVPADTSSALGNSSVADMMSASSDRYLTISMTYSTS